MLENLPQLRDLGDESRRLLHGRGGYFPSLEHVAIDWFSPVLLVTFYAEKEVNPAIVANLITTAQTRGTDVAAIVVQQRYLPKAPKETVYGELPAQVVAKESGLKYLLTLDRNQNHGFFLDMKPGRNWIQHQATGKRVLNLFSYTCSLSVAAIAGGAETVLNLDMAGAALTTGRRNHQLNFEKELYQRAGYLPHDLFKSWGRLVREAPYDVIVIDPPSNQGASFRAESHYPKVLRRLPDLMSVDCQILACLNAPHLDESFLIDLFASYTYQGRLPCAEGFEDKDPKAALKCLLFRPA